MTPEENIKLMEIAFELTKINLTQSHPVRAMEITLGIGEGKYKHENHFGIYCATMGAIQAKAMIEELNKTV